ncbi:hypothetical protein PTSG_03570 [Salpingoeca rosetta]|uniref:RWD domain-containing protein n=1 Tax=Salpingoeca rosetta (strain ATCC 50818 / BSB-021) TaxID=946362 RepID=F2U5Z6_SALR5|nr:uncharacterized protein PTSG_03570 [Salpingoeca rosetta]EGD82937.1 hypothetical protein PTSG_03570 [Salpingoeca rosetta]|eukprot:XP_004995301.1 hypothetical protein PTSG_03570 [Salpingoeca rosetta]
MPFTLNLNSFGSFNHGKRGHVTWLRPEPSSAIESLHAAMVDTLSHMGRWSRMKQPHMTVARSQPAPLTQELQQHWTPIQFEVDRVYLLQRTSSKSPMQVVGEIQLGRDSGSDDDGDGGGDSAQQEQQQRRGDDDATNSALRSLLQALNASVRRGVITRSRMVQLRRALLPPPLAVAENDRPSVEEEIEFAARVFESDGVEVQDGTTVIITVDGSDDGVQAVVDISIAFDDNHPNVTPRVTIHSAQNLTAAQQAVLALVLNTHTEHWFNTPLHPFAPEQFFVFSVFNTAAHFLRDEQSRLGTVRAVHSGGKPSVTVNNTTTNYNHLLEWRDVNTSTKQQLGTLSVRELDTLVYRALLKHMHTTLRKPTREGGRQRRYSARLTHVENVLHPTLLERYNEAVARLLDTGAVHDRSNAHADEYPEEIKTLLPRLAFHGTCERNVAESIANQGLVAPGDFDDSGRYIGMKTGALYGSGSYVSPNLLKSHWYSYQDARGHAQMLVGLAIPGRCRQFTADSISQIRRDGLEIHDLECDSHTDPSKEELILYTSDLFLPVLLIEYALTDEQVNPPSAPALKGSVEALDDVQQFAVAHLLSLPPSSSSSSPSSLSSSSMPAHGEPSAAKQQKQQKKKKHGGSADGEKGEVKGEWNKLMAALGPRTKQTLQLQLTQEHWLLELRPALFQPATMPLHGGGGGGGAHHHMVLCLARFPDIKGSMLSDLASGVELLIRYR